MGNQANRKNINKASTHIAVLLGGLSSEREVSLRSGAAVSSALRELGYKVTDIDVNRNLVEELKSIQPDIAYNALHGTYGEDGAVQGVLELLQIPYTHSGLMASALAFDKTMAKRVFASAGIQCPKGKMVTIKEILAGDVLPRPFVLKPNNDGSSVGVYILREKDNFFFDDKNAPPYKEMLAEEFIEGRELSVAVLDGKALGVIEIRPKTKFYDYTNKYTSGMTDYLMPAPVDKKMYDKAMEMGALAHQVLGCRGVTRSDIRYDDKKGELYLLEINTHPGMTATSLTPKIAGAVGISFPELLETLVSTARCDNVQKQAKNTDVKASV